MNKLIVIGGLCVIFYACTKKTEVKETEISFEMKTFRVESQGGCSTDTLPCAYYAVNYPLFKGLDTAVQKNLKSEIDASVAMGNPEAEGKTMAEIGKGFVDEFEEFKKDDPDRTAGWHYASNVNVEILSDTLLSLSLEEEYYTGGAHGGHGMFFININPSNGATFTLDDFLKPGYEDALDKIGEKNFRKVRELPDTASLDENYFEFPENKFQLNKNYGFKKDGLVFYFNSYEIAAYAAGPTEVVIRYDELKDLIR